MTALEVNHWGTRGIFADGRGYAGFVVEGPSGTVFFPGDTAYTPLFREYGERFRIGIGDLMRFDVLGRTIEARVTSVRDRFGLESAPQ